MNVDGVSVYVLEVDYKNYFVYIDIKFEYNKFNVNILISEFVFMDLIMLLVS